MIAFGGAGPVHAVSLAEELQIPEVIVPPAPGAFSALGLVTSDLRRDYSRTLYADLGSSTFNSIGNTAVATFFPGTVVSGKIGYNASIFRAGVNYKF